MAEKDNAKPGRYRKRGDERLLIALAAGQSIRQAARKAGLGEATVARRLEDPVFRQRLNALRSRLVDRALGRLAATMAAASSTLRQLLRAQSEAVRLSAARSIVELHVRLKEAGEMEARVAELEE